MSGLRELEPGIRRLVAANPSPMTAEGTNSYILGRGEVAIVDPGPEDPAHLDAILSAVAGERVSHVLVTHAHRDHSPLAPVLAARLGAPVAAFGNARAGRSARMAGIGAVGGGEGVDHAFRPDRLLADGERIAVGGGSVQALWTPGHFGNHLCFAFGDACLTGDLVMGWASSLVSPPDGDLTDFMESCRRLARVSWRVLYPGHGDPVADPAARLSWLIAHREGREAQILDALSDGPAVIADLVARLYADVDGALHGAAARNVLAHLIDLEARGLVATDRETAPDAPWSRR